jgi:shikimate dehydrogenase
MRITGEAKVAGVVGAPVRRSLSPIIHNTWLAAASVDGAYVPLPVPADGFDAFVTGCRGGVLRGVNVTAPFKERALELADIADGVAQAAGSANLLLFRDDGVVEARNTDGAGLLHALTRQAPALQLKGARVVVVGAGGASRGAAATLLEAGAAELRILNRTYQRARALADPLGPAAKAYPWECLAEVFAGADLVVNATSAGVRDSDPLDPPWNAAVAGAVAMDMTYTPLRTAFLTGAAERGLTTVDGLEMLIGQARPSFEAFFGVAAPEDVDARAVALAALEGR